MSHIQRIAIYGKGGIGKSVVATSLSMAFAMQQKRVLHVGCDPKADSAVRLMDGGVRIPTVLDVMGRDHMLVSPEQVIHEGRRGIHCCEAGGPPPGLGCGGRGVARTLEYMEDMDLVSPDRYDVAVFDVLGDVVCGGFAAPLRKGFGDKVFIVLSEEPMSIYAANNISRAVEIYEQNGVVLGGLIVNLRENTEMYMPMLRAFSDRLSTRIVGVIPRDRRIMEAERHSKTVLEYAPDSEAAAAFSALAKMVWEFNPKDAVRPTPLTHEEFYKFMETF